MTADRALPEERPLIETDLPVLAALAEVEPPPADSAGARFLRAAWHAGADGVPPADEDVWATWVDLGLWRGSTTSGPVHLTAHARADLVALAVGLGRAGVPEQGTAARTGLTGDQDARLRTLAALKELGELSPELQHLRRSYRERDQRTAVRPPAQVTWPAPKGQGDPA